MQSKLHEKILKRTKYFAVVYLTLEQNILSQKRNSKALKDWLYAQKYAFYDQWGEEDQKEEKLCF